MTAAASSEAPGRRSHPVIDGTWPAMLAHLAARRAHRISSRVDGELSDGLEPYTFMRHCSWFCACHDFCPSVP